MFSIIYKLFSKIVLIHRNCRSDFNRLKPWIIFHIFTLTICDIRSMDSFWWENRQIFILRKDNNLSLRTLPQVPELILAPRDWSPFYVQYITNAAVQPGRLKKHELEKKTVFVQVQWHLCLVQNTNYKSREMKRITRGLLGITFSCEVKKKMPLFGPSWAEFRDPMQYGSVQKSLEHSVLLCCAFNPSRLPKAAEWPEA